MAGLKERIRAEAMEVYLREGMAGLSMRALAARLGVSATAIYRHFRGKEDLVHHLMGEALEAFAGYLLRALAGTTPQERLRLGGEAYLDFALEHGKYYEALFMDTRGVGMRGLPPELRQKSLASFQFLVDRVQECMECGYLRRDDPTAVAMSLWAHTHGMASIFLAGRLPFDAAGFRKLFIESRLRLLRGLRAAETE
jgi:AcrR family transcriptional regulator